MSQVHRILTAGAPGSTRWRRARGRWSSCCTAFRSPGTPGDTRFPHSPPRATAWWPSTSADTGVRRSTVSNRPIASRNWSATCSVSLDAYGEDKAVVVGHDWGAPGRLDLRLAAPGRCAGVVGISVPFAGRGVIGLPGSPFGERPPQRLPPASSPATARSGTRTTSPPRTASSPRSRKTCAAGCSA